MVLKWQFIRRKFSRYFSNKLPKSGIGKICVLWHNKTVEPTDTLRTSKWASDPNFWEKILCGPQKMTKNGHKMVIFEVTIRLGESDFKSKSRWDIGTYSLLHTLPWCKRYLPVERMLVNLELDTNLQETREWTNKVY